MAQAGLRACRTHADEFGQEPDASRRDDAQRQGPAAPHVRQHEQGAIRRVAWRPNLAAFGARTSRARQPECASRRTRRSTVPQSGSAGALGLRPIEPGWALKSNTSASIHTNQGGPCCAARTVHATASENDIVVTGLLAPPIQFKSGDQGDDLALPVSACRRASSSNAIVRRVLLHAMNPVTKSSSGRNPISETMSCPSAPA